MGTEIKKLKKELAEAIADRDALAEELALSWFRKLDTMDAATCVEADKGYWLKWAADRAKEKQNPSNPRWLEEGGGE